jgi:hypothetical protein
MNSDRRFRNVQRYADAHGFFAGFPNFHEAEYGDGVVYGTILLRDTEAEWRAVLRSEYNNISIDDVPALFRAANDYADRLGYPAAFPNCEQGDEGQGVVYGTILMKPGTTEWRDVPRAELGAGLAIGDVPAMMRAANDYSDREGFAAGFPTFHQADYGQGVVYGIVLLKPGVSTWRDISADFLRRYTQPMPWKIILCHASDDSPIFRGLEKATRFFTRSGAGTGNAYDYFRDISYGTIDIGDSTIHGPFAMPADLEQISQYKSHDQRAAVFKWGVEAAGRNGVAIDGRTDHVCIVFSSPCDSGQVDSRHVVLCAPFGPTEMFMEQGFVMHEMGHAMGLRHSFGENDTACADPGVPGEYCDSFDIMSYANVQGFNVDPMLPISRGPGAHCVNLDRLGAMDHARIWRAPLGEFDTLVTLAALNRADVDAPLMATFEASSRHPNMMGFSTYSLEYRERTGWDRGLGVNAVLVRETTTPRHTILLTNYHGGVLSLDDPFVTPDQRFSVRLVSFNWGTSTATVRIQSLQGGTPYRVRIEEIVLDPPGGNPLNERVIITNGGATAVDMNGWKLIDAAPVMPHVFTFPALTLQPGAAAVVWTKVGNDNFPNFFWNRMTAVWNNTGDTATLRDANGQIVSQLSVP